MARGGLMLTYLAFGTEGDYLTPSAQFEIDEYFWSMMSIHKNVRSKKNCEFTVPSTLSLFQARYMNSNIR